MILNTNFNNILTTYQGNKIKMVTKAVTDKTRGAYGDVTYYCSVYVSPISLLDNGQFQYDESEILLVEETILPSSFVGDEAILTYRVPTYEYDAKYTFHIYTKDERGNSQTEKTVECIGVCNKSSSAKVIKGAWNNTKLEVEVEATLGHINPKNKAKYNDAWTAYVSAITSLLGNISYQWVLYVGQADKTATSEAQGHVIKQDAITLANATQNLHKTYAITRDTVTGLELNPESSYYMYVKLEIVDTPVSTTEDITLNRECSWSEKLLSEIFTPPWTIRKGTVRAFSPYKWENINTGAMIVNKSSASADATATLALYDTHQTTGGQAANTPNIGFFDDKHKLLGEIKAEEGSVILKKGTISAGVGNAGIETTRRKSNGTISKIKTREFHASRSGLKLDFYDDDALTSELKAVDPNSEYMSFEIEPGSLALTMPNVDAQGRKGYIEGIRINAPFTNTINGDFINDNVFINRGRFSNIKHFSNETTFVNAIPSTHPNAFDGAFINKAPFLNTVGIKAEGSITIGENSYVQVSDNGTVSVSGASANISNTDFYVMDGNNHSIGLGRQAAGFNLTSTANDNGDMTNFLLQCEDNGAGTKTAGLDIRSHDSCVLKMIGKADDTLGDAQIELSMIWHEGEENQTGVNIVLTNPTPNKIGYVYGGNTHTLATEEFVKGQGIKTKVIDGWTIIEYPNKVIQMYKIIGKNDCSYLGGPTQMQSWWRYLLKVSIPNNILASVTGFTANGYAYGGSWSAANNGATPNNLIIALESDAPRGLNSTTFPTDYPTVCIYGIAK